MEPYDENENENAETGFEQGEDDELHMRMEMLARIAPEEIIQNLVEQAHEEIQNITNKVGNLLGAAGHSTFRASLGHVPNQLGSGSMVATVLISLDVDALSAQGHNPEEVQSAIAGSFNALNDYFKTLGPEED